ncbi:cytochrome P450 [Aspergillus karnatakaensis]|uniref:cytochrome P450 n=1 Tax=Aspergillus karnatakaensis TaxID=1810916 RepID=UPI003CCD5FF2
MAHTLLLTLLTLLLTHLTITPLIRSLLQTRKARSLGCLPAPKLQMRDPLFGTDILLRIFKALRSHSLLEQLDVIYTEYGTTVHTPIMALPPITTIEPENVKAVLSDINTFGLGPRRIQMLGPLSGHGIFTTEGGAWKRSRTLLRPNLTKSHALNLPMFERHISDLLHLIPKDNTTVNLQTLFTSLTVDSGTELLFGVSSNSLRETKEVDTNSSFAKSLDAAQEEIVKRDILGPVLVKLRSSREFKRNLKTVHEFIDGYVAKALASYKAEEEREAEEKRQLQGKGNAEEGEGEGEGGEEKRYIFLRELSRQTTDPLALRWETLNVLIAGRDTTAVLLSNTWFMLSRRPDIWTKLKAQLTSLDGTAPTYQQLTELKYVRWILLETLRLYPVLPINARTANVDTTIPRGGGKDGKSPVFIPKGSEVAWNTWSMHRRKDYFGSDADEFVPERWEHLRPGWEYLPFNGGPRRCLGEEYALMEAAYTIVRMAQRFSSVESRDDRPWTEKMGVVTSSLYGCHVAVTWE